MCQSAHAMYEGKNLHYSPTDNKPLCSYSGKVCNQRRLNGFGFCVRHILEDKSAPYKQCSYVAKSSNQMCTQAIPKDQQRQYCNNHMQVLGMAPRKEKRKKEKEVITPQGENRLSFEDRLKSKIGLKARVIEKDDSMLEDPDDPYAFPGNVSVESQPPKSLNSVVPPNSNCESTSKVSQLSPGATRSPSDSGSSVAKQFPELAERVRTRTESKGKGRHSSRSVKELSSKIAQKKLDKSKLRKSQDASLMEMSPSSHGSPDCSSGSVAAPSPGVSNSSVISPLSGPTATGLSPLPPPPPPPQHYDGAVRSPLPLRGAPVVSNFSTSSSGLHLNHSTVSSQLHSPSSLPPPYPGPSASLLAEQREASSSKRLLETLSSSKPPASSSLSSVPPPSVPPHPVVRLPPPPPYVPPSHSLPSVPVSSSSVLSSRPQQEKRAAEDGDLWNLFKVEPAVKFAKLSLQQKQYNTNVLGRGLCSSDESDSDLDDADIQPTLKYCFTPSSDDENNEDEDNEQDDDENLQDIRTTKLALLRTRYRRQCQQARSAARGNTALHRLRNKKTLLLVQTARQSPTAAVHALRYLHRKLGTQTRLKKLPAKKLCCYTNEKDEKCRNLCLPSTNHCRRHIMYNISQLLFSYCTAKFPDNTQCCVPVFDILHDFPLCPQHAAKADQLKAQEAEVKKRPRKKTKPPALTRPPKKGKKKKKARNVRPEISVPAEIPSQELPVVGSGETNEEVKVVEEVTSETEVGGEVNGMEVSTGEVAPIQPPCLEPPTPVATPATIAPSPIEPPPAPTVSFSSSKDTAEPFKDLVESLDMESELPIEQASRLLEEGDFQEVFNRLDDDAFGDIFSVVGKNGDYEPSREETEELERKLAEANSVVARTREYLEKLSKGEISGKDLDINQLVETLSNHQGTNFLDSNLSVGNLPSASFADLNLDNSLTLSRIMNATALNTLPQALGMPASQDFLRQHLQPVMQQQAQSQLPAQQQQQQQQNYGFVPSQSSIVSLSGINSAVNSVIGSQGVITSTCMSTNGPSLGGSFPVGNGSQSVVVSSAHDRSYSSVPISLPGYSGGLTFGNLPQNVMLTTGSSSLLPNSGHPGATVGQLGLEPSSASALPQQLQLHSGAVLASQMPGTRPGWPAQVNTPTINPAAYQNGFPARPGFTGGPTMTVNQNAKFVPGGSAQGSLGDYAGKQDGLFPPISHSMGVPVIPTTQGYPSLSQSGSNFSSVPPPYTSS